MTRIVIADDHPFIIAGLESILRDTSFEVVGKLNDGQAVLDSLARLRPDILLLDVMMPVQSGIDVARILRSRSDRRPIVLLTASLDDQRLVEALKLEIEGIVLKEGAEKQLLDCLERVRNGGRWIDPAVLQRAVELAKPGAAPADPLAGVTQRERAIVGLVAQGLRNRDIASELGMTEGTVKVYLHRIYEKLGVSNRTELAILSRRTGER